MHLTKTTIGVGAGVVVGVGSFFGLASEVFEGETATFDRVLLLALRNPDNLADPIGPVWVEEALRDLTALGGSAVLTLLVLSAILYLSFVRRPRAAAFLGMVVVAGLGVANVLKHLYARSRPDLVPKIVLASSSSFPSSHAMMAALVYLSLGALLAHTHPDRRVKSFMVAMGLLLTILVGISRVYLGVHWPTDVVAGWALGAAWAGAAWMVAIWLEERGWIESGGTGRSISPVV